MKTYKQRTDSILKKAERQKSIRKKVTISAIAATACAALTAFSLVLFTPFKVPENPINAYKKEGHEMFEEMTEAIREETIRVLLKLKVNIERMPSKEVQNKTYNMSKSQLSPQVSNPIKVEKAPGRNDPCPCGSGKKYKNCCGR